MSSDGGEPDREGRPGLTLAIASFGTLLVLMVFTIPLTRVQCIDPIIKAEMKRMSEQSLNQQQRSIVPIAAFAANGDLDKLKTALNDGLDSGLTINEIKEVLVQMYAYAGFPRSLNAIQSFMTVLSERQANGINDEIGREASPVPAYMDRDEYGANSPAWTSFRRQAAISSLFPLSIPS